MTEICFYRETQRHGVFFEKPKDSVPQCLL